MSDWTGRELETIAGTDELEIAPGGDDGGLREPTTIWVVGDGDGLYVRSYRGGDGAWYRAARANGHGRISSGGVTKDVDFADAAGDPDLNARLDDAYRAKYGGYPSQYVDPMVADTARATTLRLVAR
ncbi:DUF2255 family protein [Actinomadura verrucosospora]|uniref:DUF2255 family protein n=1 Tax=Actinomadura verrucosospora TaxID=46165 RepID=A0A7D3ZHP0_ACTVE|nr:DUF2255 family protein [Actinomadura verrucosospora]QKG19821.1 hypothetical protein ACTIVE_1457 [Actinomadura verrucosospora]